MDATDIIEAFGGYARLADMLGIGRTGVFNWYKSGIPKTRCLELRALARARGLRHITLEVLMLSSPRNHEFPTRKSVTRRDKTAAP